MCGWQLTLQVCVSKVDNLAQRGVWWLQAQERSLSRRYGKKLRSSLQGPADTTDLSTSKPTLTGKVKGGGSVEIAFNKSTSDGVNSYCRRDGDPGPVFLARDTAPPYVDNRPLLVAGKPEVRDYRALYVVSDAEIDSPSDEAVITATP
jgi:hypothetical protein